MGLNPDVFDSMTPAEFVYAQYGYMNYKRAEAHQAWEIARFSTYHQMIIQIERKDRTPMYEMFPFVWDKPIENKQRRQLTKEERRERVRQILGK